MGTAAPVRRALEPCGVLISPVREMNAALLEDKIAMA
jgi:hypothetical protein